MRIERQRADVGAVRRNPLQAGGARREGEIGGRVVEDARQRPRGPEELPRTREAEVRGAGIQNLEHGRHRDEDRRKQHRDLHQWHEREDV